MTVEQTLGQVVVGFCWGVGFLLAVWLFRAVGVILW